MPLQCRPVQANAMQAIHGLDRKCLTSNSVTQTLFSSPAIILQEDKPLAIVQKAILRKGYVDILCYCREPFSCPYKHFEHIIMRMSRMIFNYKISGSHIPVLAFVEW